MNGLDLFSGIGGVAIALREYVFPVAYCEIDRYSQGVLLNRMADGNLPRAPIWDDIRSLKGADIPRPVDIIFGGFPCQDISCAGRGVGLEGQRSSLFFEIVRLVDELQPTFVFLENVPAIRGRGMGRIIHEFASRGFSSRWTTLSAAAVGAPHLRKRWWFLAYSDSNALREQSRRFCGTTRTAANESRADGQKEHLAHPDYEGVGWRGLRSKFIADQTKNVRSAWAFEPNVGRVAHGIPHRMDRIRGLGNAVVPLCAQTAFCYLMGIDFNFEKDDAA